MLFHALEGGGGQLAAGDGAGVAGHALAGGAAEEAPSSACEQPAQVAVRDAAHQAASVVSAATTAVMPSAFFDIS